MGPRPILSSIPKKSKRPCRANIKRAVPSNLTPLAGDPKTHGIVAHYPAQLEQQDSSKPATLNLSPSSRRPVKPTGRDFQHSRLAETNGAQALAVPRRTLHGTEASPTRLPPRLLPIRRMGRLTPYIQTNSASARTIASRILVPPPTGESRHAHDRHGSRRRRQTTDS